MAVNRPNRVGCGTLGHQVADAEDESLAQANQHQTVHRAMNGSNHLPAHPLAARTKRAGAGALQLRVHLVTILEQEEKCQQGEAEQDGAMGDVRTQFAAVRDQVRLAGFLKQF